MTSSDTGSADPTHAPRESLWLGIDTGGTFTDAVVLAGGRRVLAAAKALTTHSDLAIGIGAALRAVLDRLPRDARAQVELVSVSTTLATNAVVESRFSPICTLLIGFDAGMVERSGLARQAGALVRVDGGHAASGEESAPLDEAAIERAVREHDPSVEAYAVAASFSVRNPAHEERARRLVRALSRKPVTCAHELSSQLDAPRRALTAALNARLTPQIRHLIEALTSVLASESLDVPLMIVKGDGSLMKAEIALEYPVETILSGPAASVVGAGFLTGLQDFVVSDMGGTTTDIAIVAGGRPVIRAEGALVGAWRTMVEAVDVRTSGLGGDSEVSLDRKARLTIGPRKVMPLSLLAQRFPSVLGSLRSLAALERLPEPAALFACRNPARSVPPYLSALERRICETLTPDPRPVSAIAHNRSGREALRRLADAGVATLAGMTPSDAMHVLGRQEGWCREAAECGARILATEERNFLAAAGALTAAAMCARILESVTAQSARLVLAAALAHDPGIALSTAGTAGADGTDGLGARILEDTAAGRRFSDLVAASLQLNRPLVAIGAPVGAYYPEVARRIGATLSMPEHGAVCNAVGAVAGVVSQRVDILVDQPAFKTFRVLDPAGSRDYPDPEPAIDHARRVSRELALAAALRAGAGGPPVATSVVRRLAKLAPGTEYLAEALVRSVATGRPS